MTSQQCAVECLLNKGGKVLSTMPQKQTDAWSDENAID
jgi:hypothetical protein